MKNYFKSAKTLGLGLPSSLYTKVDDKAETNMKEQKQSILNLELSAGHQTNRSFMSKKTETARPTTHNTSLSKHSKTTRFTAKSFRTDMEIIKEDNDENFSRR